jgi:resolvase-like protein
MTLYGYARVSTRDQDLLAQNSELMAAGCAKVFKEKVSGAKTDRPELAKLIRRLEPGDVLMVVRLDRLARSTKDLLNVLDEVGKRDAGFRSLKDTWADTTTPHGKLMVTVLGGLAEFERSLIVARTGEGASVRRTAACASEDRMCSRRTNGKRHCSASTPARVCLTLLDPSRAITARSVGWQLPALSGQARSACEEAPRLTVLAHATQVGITSAR